MYTAPEQFAALNKANLEAATRFATVAFGGVERLFGLQLQAAKTAMADGVENAKTFAAVKDLQQFADVKDSVAQPAFEKATEFAKSFYDVASETQAELGKLVEQQVVALNSQFVGALDQFAKNAPAGSEAGISAIKSALVSGNTAYENFTKAAKQFNDTAKTNLEAVAKRAAPVAKKAKK